MSPHSRNLRSAWAKHHQAERRARELSAFVDDFFEDRSHRSRMRADFESGWYVLRVTSVPDLESFIDELGVLAGEIVHHLRSALDHLGGSLRVSAQTGHRRIREMSLSRCVNQQQALCTAVPLPS